jgi:hypothetical protein
MFALYGPPFLPDNLKRNGSDYFFLMLPAPASLLLPMHGNQLLTTMSGSQVPTQEHLTLELVCSQPRWLGHTNLQ